MFEWPYTCKSAVFFAASAAEEYTGGYLMKIRDVIIPGNTLEEIGHPQPIIKLCKDNTTASVIKNNTTNQQRSCAMNTQHF